MRWLVWKIRHLWWQACFPGPSHFPWGRGPVPDKQSRDLIYARLDREWREREPRKP